MLYSLVVYFFLVNCNDYTEKLSGDYIFVSESGVDQRIEGQTRLNVQNVIPCTVVDYDFNDDFIIAAQLDNPNCTYNTKEHDKMNFWIISHKDNQFYGPLTLNEFIKKRIELNIPKSLALSVDI